MNPARTLTKWLAPSAALFALACALLAPAEVGSARPQETRVRQAEEPDETPDDSVVRGRVV